MCTTYLGHFEKKSIDPGAREPHSKKRTVFSCFHGTGNGCYQGNPLKQFDGASPCPNPFIF